MHGVGRCAPEYFIDCSCLQRKEDCRSRSEPDEPDEQQSNQQLVHVDFVGDSKVDCDNGADEAIGCAVVGEDRESSCLKRIFKCVTRNDKERLSLSHVGHQVRCHLVSERVTSRSLQEQRRLGYHQREARRSYSICVVVYCGHGCCDDSTAAINFDFFQCDSGPYRALASLCNGAAACEDGSDEKDVEKPGFKCRLKHHRHSCVIPQGNLFDSHAVCEHGADLCFLADGRLDATRCFPCLDGQLILSTRQVCDGIVDCYDMSDELLCKDSRLHDDMRQRAAEQKRHRKSTCPAQTFNCDRGCLPYKQVMCDTAYMCDRQMNVKYCTSAIVAGRLQSTVKCQGRGSSHVIRAVMCDGRPECGDNRDECSDECYHRPSYCACGSDTSDKCATNQCTGLPEDTSGRKETVPASDCPARFYCQTRDGMISVDMNAVCDSRVDCIDGSDETEDLCRDKLYFCEAGFPKSIVVELVGDGVLDCEDGSDENDIRFSNQKHLIANPILRHSYWIMGALSFMGNLGVMLSTIVELKQLDEGSNIALIQKALLINLSFSDFLMSFYLFFVSYKSLVSSGFYTDCQFEWRSSVTCTVIGATAWISLQSSANTLALLTFYRVLGVCKPFLAARMSLKLVLLSIFISWVVCIGFGVLPAMPWFQEYFTGSLWYPNYFTRTSQVSKEYIVRMANEIRPAAGMTMGAMRWGQ